MTTAEFEARVARLEEHLVSESAEEMLENAEQLFAKHGNTVWARCALLRAQSSYQDDRRGWEDEGDA